jgi:hypothetical protein
MAWHRAKTGHSDREVNDLLAMPFRFTIRDLLWLPLAVAML